MTIAIDVSIRGLDRLAARLGRLALGKSELLETIGYIAARQHRRRIEIEKRSPEGAAWKPARDNPNTLVRSGRLAGSIDYRVEGDGVRVGSMIAAPPYPAVHQRGAVIRPRKARVLRFVAGGRVFFRRSVTVPARPWLGVSAENRRELRDEIKAAVRDLVGAA